MKYSKNRLVYGVGVNDADYNVNRTEDINGKRVIVWRCPFYRKWKEMLRRCYSPEYQAKYPTYIGCSVHENWFIFSNFKAWMENKNWEKKELDKDLIVSGNKIYSPETCVFLDKLTNYFSNGKDSCRGEYKIGVSFHKSTGRFQSQVQNPFTQKNEYLGLFSCHEDAHAAWKTRKHELACQLAELQSDLRVAQTLRVKYL